MKNYATDVLNAAFLKRLVVAHQSFDENECMLTEQMMKKSYHSSLECKKVHLTYASMEYAAALLYTCNEDNIKRAVDIIDKVLPLQDNDTNSFTYGIWPYFLEEPFEKMKAPDWNWADFVGKILVHLLVDHCNRLPEELVERIEKSLYHAAASIMRRNIGPDYTNINLMGAFVTVKAGELLKNDELFEYGKKRLIKEVKFVRANGGFSEYNSPSYTILALEEIGRMLKYFSDHECLEAARVLNDLEWSSIAHHFHPSTKQLSAPHSRCYANITGKTLASFIQIATGMRLGLIDEDELQVGLLWNHMVIECPEKYHLYFEPITEPRLFKEKFYKGIDIISEDETRVLIEKGTPELEATTYMNPYFSLGTFAQYDLWNQRRPLMAYWGTPEKCAYIKLRCLHDGHDYCSAMICTSQDQNHVVGGVYFVKDHGDYHFILDPLKDGTITAKKLSLRFEIGGYIDNLSIPADISMGTAFDISAGDVAIRINPMFCTFNDEKISIAAGKDEETCWIDFVLYEGNEKTLDFNIVNSAAFVFGFSIFDKEICLDDGSCYSYALREEDNTVKAELNRAGVVSSIEIPLEPSNYIKNPVEGQVKKVKCGGFIYEKV